MTKRVVVVGGGPAGLAAAIAAAGGGADAVVMEKNDRCGVKLLATGGGHCNLGNLLPEDEWPARFGRRGRFIVPALRLLPRDKLCAWMKEMGVAVHSQDGFHLFPVANSARTVRDALVAEAERLGVAFRRSARVDGLALDGGAIRGVRVGDEVIACDSVVIAAGGRSVPASGSNGDGCMLAEQAGHAVTPQYPGLVGLRAANLSPDLAGLVLSEAEVFFRVKGKGVLRGTVIGGRELLLTHIGVSGPAVLDLSAAVAEAIGKGKGAEATLLLRWRAGMDQNAWRDRLESWRRERGASAFAGVLGEYVPRRLARWLCGAAGIGESATPATLRAGERERLAELLGSFPVRVTGTEGWDKAMITRGGVDLPEVDPETLASRLVRGLAFAGETLDVDGPCGGYNLHWAFASGMLAGSMAAR